MDVKVKSYTRKGKNGKTYTVKGHTRKGKAGRKQQASQPTSTDGFIDVGEGLQVKRWDESLTKKPAPGAEIVKKQVERKKEPQVNRMSQKEMEEYRRKQDMERWPAWRKQQAKQATTQPKESRVSKAKKVISNINRKLNKRYYELLEKKRQLKG